MRPRPPTQGLLLRAVIAVGPPVALLAAAPEGHVPSVWFLMLVVVASLVFAIMPEQFAAGVPLLLVVGWWSAAVQGGVPAAVVVAAAALLAAHAAATLAAYGPTSLPPERRVVLLWLRRCAAIWVLAPVLWLALAVQQGQTTPGAYWEAGLAVALVAVVVVALRYPTRLDRGT